MFITILLVAFVNTITDKELIVGYLWYYAGVIPSDSLAPYLQYKDKEYETVVKKLCYTLAKGGSGRFHFENNVSIYNNLN